MIKLPATIIKLTVAALIGLTLSSCAAEDPFDVYRVTSDGWQHTSLPKSINTNGYIIDPRVKWFHKDGEYLYCPLYEEYGKCKTYWRIYSVENNALKLEHEIIWLR